MTVLIDSDILIEVDRPEYAGRADPVFARDRGRTLGGRPAPRTQRIAKALRRTHVRRGRPGDRPTAREYINRYRGSHGVGLADVIIAAIAVSNGNGCAPDRAAAHRPELHVHPRGVILAVAESLWPLRNAA